MWTRSDEAGGGSGLGTSVYAGGWPNLVTRAACMVVMVLVVEKWLWVVVLRKWCLVVRRVWEWRIKVADLWLWRGVISIILRSICSFEISTLAVAYISLVNTRNPRSRTVSGGI
jgi:hypothetical protein